MWHRVKKLVSPPTLPTLLVRSQLATVSDLLVVHQQVVPIVLECDIGGDIHGLLSHRDLFANIVCSLKGVASVLLPGSS